MKHQCLSVCVCSPQENFDFRHHKVASESNYLTCTAITRTYTAYIYILLLLFWSSTNSNADRCFQGGGGG